MRKRNLSVYDMQRELAGAGHTISINCLTVLLREEGFSRLPRRAESFEARRQMGKWTGDLGNLGTAMTHRRRA